VICKFCNENYNKKDTDARLKRMFCSAQCERWDYEDSLERGEVEL